jgi:hypothetical protein
MSEPATLKVAHAGDGIAMAGAFMKFGVEPVSESY